MKTIKERIYLAEGEITYLKSLLEANLLGSVDRPNKASDVKTHAAILALLDKHKKSEKGVVNDSGQGSSQDNAQ